jgi:hypothetical protein
MQRNISIFLTWRVALHKLSLEHLVAETHLDRVLLHLFKIPWSGRRVIVHRIAVDLVFT